MQPPPGMAGNSHRNSRKNGNPAAHLKDYQFKPGQSGNPEGRPRGIKEFAELIAKQTRDGAELVEYALKVLRSKSVKAPKVWAVEYLTERMLGKAPQIGVHPVGTSSCQTSAGWACQRFKAAKIANTAPHPRLAVFEGQAYAWSVPLG